MSDSTQSGSAPPRYVEDEYECFLPRACELRDEYNAQLDALLRVAGSDVDEAGLMAGTWSHAQGWSRLQSDDDEVTKARFRDLWNWARKEFDAAVDRQRSGTAPERMKVVRRQIACAFYHSVYDPAIERQGAWADTLLSFGWVAHEELLQCKRKAWPAPRAPVHENRPSSLPAGRSQQLRERPPELRLPKTTQTPAGWVFKLFGDETPEECVRRFLDPDPTWRRAV